MIKQVKTTCPLDCFDLCSIVATVEDGRVIKVEGDRAHPVTKGFICKKGRNHLQRQYHPQRVESPLRKIGENFCEISWEEAISQIAENLSAIVSQYGPTAVLNYTSSGYGGILKMVDSVFFHCLGGATIPVGTLCWDAGIAAQKYDFGHVRGHCLADLENARTIFLWGRNPAYTNIHLLPYLKKARKNGAIITLIDPLRTATSSHCDHHIRINPSTDGALALGMASYIMEKGLYDETYVKRYVKGFNRFRNYAAGFSLSRVEEITGVKRDSICQLAESYAVDKPSSIMVGFGMQRYSNGGNNVRCIDALGAITGNIGLSGGGVNYANRSIADYMAGPEKIAGGDAGIFRKFSIVNLGQFLEEAVDPQIKAIFVSRANPLAQSPDTKRVGHAFGKIPFKVVIDTFLTDTASNADIVLPATTFLEENDLFYTSMLNPCIRYSHKAVDPPVNVMSEFDFFANLAEKMNLSNYPAMGKDEYLQAVMAPLFKEFNITLDDLKKREFIIPGLEIPWNDGNFSTPSGKYELFSERAIKDGIDPLPTHIAPLTGNELFPLRLITPHHKDSLHSQHFAFKENLPTVYVSKNTLKKFNLTDGGNAQLSSFVGKIEVIVGLSDSVCDEVVMIYEGWWHKSGNVNVLTPAIISDMGGQAAFYDCFCNISPVDI